MKRKSLLVLLSAVILGLSACGSGSSGDASQSSATSTGTSESAMSSSDSKTETTYTVVWKNYDGRVLETDEDVKNGTMPHYDGANPTRPDDEEYSYTWTGWTPELTAVTSDQTYTATYSATSLVTTYTITYILDGGTNASTNPSTYVAGTTFTFADASKTGYTFAGWFDSNGNQITGIEAGTAGNLTLTAHWTANKNTLSVTSEDTSKGTVEITSGSGYSGESITVVATPAFAYEFDGWYNGSNKVSTKTTYTFTMPTGDYSLVARFGFDEELAAKLGMTPVISIDGKTLTYGLYPQKNVADSTLISALNALTASSVNGWYLYNDQYYAKLEATPLKSGYKFDNGTTIVNGTTYWFKCEPITWKILNNNGGVYYLLSSVPLDAQCYYHSQEERIINDSVVYPNDYEDSDIRSWLNNEFFNTAFYLDNDNIQETLVDNSASSTHSPDNWWWCNDTKDKVFLPSYQDYINTNYGFESKTDSSETRKSKSTDWSRARGIYYYTKANPYYSWHWTRSPREHHESIYSSWGIDSYGRLDSSDVSFAGGSVRPALNIKLS